MPSYFCNKKTQEKYNVKNISKKTQVKTHLEFFGAKKIFLCMFFLAVKNIYLKKLQKKREERILD
jgi:hypothetical protein